jgi:hypothetical protein
MKIVGHLFKNMPKLGLKSTTDEVSLRHSNVYREFLAEREEIMKHKWIESEKAGHDIGYDRALLDWILNHREKWRISYRKTNK